MTLDELKIQVANDLKVNDERLDPIWSICGELNIPVLIFLALYKPNPTKVNR